MENIKKNKKSWINCFNTKYYDNLRFILTSLCVIKLKTTFLDDFKQSCKSNGDLGVRETTVSAVGIKVVKVPNPEPFSPLYSARWS